MLDIYSARRDHTDGRPCPSTAGQAPAAPE